MTEEEWKEALEGIYNMQMYVPMVDIVEALIDAGPDLAALKILRAQLLQQKNQLMVEWKNGTPEERLYLEENLERPTIKNWKLI